MRWHAHTRKRNSQLNGLEASRNPSPDSVSRVIQFRPWFIFCGIVPRLSLALYSKDVQRPNLSSER